MFMSRGARVQNTSVLYPFLTTRIGNQVWMAEDFQPTHYNNGDPISYGEDDGIWDTYTNGGDGAYCYYQFVSTNPYLYYNWYVFTDARGVLPPGWRLPTLSDVVTLATYYDPNSVTPSLNGTISTTAGDALKLTPGNWSTPNSNTNLSNFSANANGFIDNLGSFYSQDDYVYYRLGDSNAFRLRYEDGNILYSTMDQTFGTSIRLVTDA